MPSYKNTPRYPTAQNAFQGIEFLPVVKSLLPQPYNSGKFDHHITHQFTFLTSSQSYRIVPQCTKPPNQQVLYYLVYNNRLQRVEYAVGPNELSQFVEKASVFVWLAGSFYVMGRLPQHVIKTLQMQYFLKRGQLWNALKAFKGSWAAAIRNPVWWTEALMSIPTAAAMRQAYKPARAVSGKAPLPNKLSPPPQQLRPNTAKPPVSKPPQPINIAVREGGFGDASGCLWAKIFHQEGTIIYQIDGIIAGPTRAVMAKHREMIVRAATEAQKLGYKSFTMIGKDAGPNFVRHANQLNHSLGTGTATTISKGSSYIDYQIKLNVQKVLSSQ